MSEEQGLTPYETREILFYKTENGEVRVEILLFQENLWLTQAKMAELFEVQKAAISKHLKNIFESGELSEDSVVSKMETTAADGKRYQTNYYNLDAIIAVGYRVNSKKATMFRIWANRVLKEFIIKGYVMDDARLREPENFFGKDYFEEQLERIRDIRASERRFYQKITDIYSQCSADYDVESPITKEFFATVQNKLHYAVTHHTAAEIVYGRADSTKPNMGLTTWKNAPKGRIRKSDVTVAKKPIPFHEQTPHGASCSTQISSETPAASSGSGKDALFPDHDPASIPESGNMIPAPAPVSHSDPNDLLRWKILSIFHGLPPVSFLPGAGM